MIRKHKVVTAVTVLLSAASALHSIHFNNDMDAPITAAQEAGYPNLEWKSTTTGFMFPVDGCGVIPPSKLVEFREQKTKQTILVCQYEFLGTPVVVKA